MAPLLFCSIFVYLLLTGSHIRDGGGDEGDQGGQEILHGYHLDRLVD